MLSEGELFVQEDPQVFGLLSPRDPHAILCDRTGGNKSYFKPQETKTHEGLQYCKKCQGAEPIVGVR